MAPCSRPSARPPVARWPGVRPQRPAAPAARWPGARSRRPAARRGARARPRRRGRGQRRRGHGHGHGRPEPRAAQPRRRPGGGSRRRVRQPSRASAPGVSGAFLSARLWDGDSSVMRIFRMTVR